MRFAGRSVIYPTLFAALLTTAATSTSTTHEPQSIATTSCTLPGPVSIEVREARFAQGAVCFEYSVATRVDGLCLRTRLEMPSGASVVSHTEVLRKEFSSAEIHHGHAVVRLAPNSNGAALRVVAEISFLGTSDRKERSIETASAATEVMVGSAGRVLLDLGLPVVDSGSEPSVELPASVVLGSVR